MKKDNDLLKSARIKRSWTPEFVSEQVGVRRTTYLRWEMGSQTPRHASLDALCKVFAMSPAELGFADERQARNDDQQSTSTNQAETIPDLAEVAPITSDLLTQWAAEIAACWQSYMDGAQVELVRLMPGYMNQLARPTLYPGPDQKLAASLTSQVYQLMALLDVQRGDFVAAQINGTQALVYSQLSKDWNVYIAAQMRLAEIYMARKRVGSALNAYNDALRRVNVDHDVISPGLHSWIFAALADIQASMGREQEAHQLLKLAFAVFPADGTAYVALPYAPCDRSLLFLYEGLVFLHLGQPRYAWDAFTQVDELKPPPSERVRAEFLKQRAYTSLVLGNMIQGCIYLEAAVKAAKAIKSELVFSEVYTLYEHMLALWGQEPRVRNLARLFLQ